MSIFNVLICFISVLGVTAEEELEVDLDTYVTPGGYVVIVIAVLIGAALVAALVLAILKERKAQIAGVNPQPSTSGQKPSALDFNKGTAFSRGKYFKEPKKTVPRKKGPFKSYPGQQPITSKDKMLFKKGETASTTNDSNANTPTSDYDLERQSSVVIDKNQNLLKKFFSKPFTKINALNSFAVGKGTKGLNAGKEKVGNESFNKDENVGKLTQNDSDTTATSGQSRNGSRIRENKSRQSGTFSRSDNKKEISNINPKSLIQPTGNVGGKTSKKSGWDVASEHFGQPVKKAGSNKRIVGGLPQVVRNKLLQEEMKKSENAKKDGWKTAQKNFAICTKRDRYVWTRNHLQHENN